jgi:hypothetical protein
MRCHRGEEHLSECPNWKSDGESEGTEVVDEQQDSGLLPWSGISFGKADLQQLVARGYPYLVGLVGLHNAGKTTMLTLLYLQLLRGQNIPEREFAGSYTLGGWEQRAHYLRLPPDGRGDGFPPHTSLNIEKREEALLHLAFRRDNERLQDVLVSDAPGEWFKEWAFKREAPLAEGARWLAKNARGFILLIDSAALAGEEKGIARSRHLSLIERLGDEAGNRPVAVVWSKADVEVSQDLRATLQKSVRSNIGNMVEFAVSVEETSQHPELDLSNPNDILGWVLKMRGQSKRDIPDLNIFRSDDPFLSYRGNP